MISAHTSSPVCSISTRGPRQVWHVGLVPSDVLVVSTEHCGGKIGFTKFHQ